jgi:hypothetical protein
VAFHTRHRDKNGEITRKNGNTLIRTCESRSIDFFEKQATQCRAQAERASNKADRESWLDMAIRWEGMLRPNHEDGAGIGNYKDRRGRTRIRRVRGRFA